MEVVALLPVSLLWAKHSLKLEKLHFQSALLWSATICLKNLSDITTLSNRVLILAQAKYPLVPLGVAQEHSCERLPHHIG